MTPCQRRRAMQEMAVWVIGLGIIIIAFDWGLK